MGWLHWLRVRLLPITPAEAQQRVDAIDQTLADLRAAVAALPPDKRATHARHIQALISAQAQARNVLSDALDNRSER